MTGNSAGTVGSDDIILMRVMSMGALDTTFDTDGKVTTAFGLSVNEASVSAP